MRNIFKHFNLAVLAGMLLLAVILGVLNNLRVDEDCRVHWLGGPVVSSEEDENEL
jgi:hypothetical protein